MELIIKDRICLIDEIDHPLIRSYTWRVLRAKSKRPNFFAVTWIARHPVYMHRLILNAQRGQEVDHINLNSLDNRRKNLRLCTRNDNLHNTAGWFERKGWRLSNIFKGVYHTSHGGKNFESRICWEGKQRYIGTFYTAEEAAKAYDDWARCFHGRYARVNFPQPGEMGVHDQSW